MQKTRRLMDENSVSFQTFLIALRTDDVTVMSEYYLSEFIIYSCLFLHFQQKKIVH